MKWKFTFTYRGILETLEIEQEDLLYAISDFLYQVSSHSYIEKIEKIKDLPTKEIF